MNESGWKSFNYGVGMFGRAIPINLLRTYAAIFYVGQLGLTTVQLSMVLFFYSFIDTLEPSVFGFLSDRTRSPWGRRRPWLAACAPLVAVSVVAFFSPPGGLSGGALLLYGMSFYILTGTFDSIIIANYVALFPEMFITSAGRAKANALRQIFQLVAMAISIALTPVVAHAIGYSTTALVYALVACAVILYTTFTSREDPLASAQVAPGLTESLKALFANRKFWGVGLTNLCYNCAMALVVVSLPFFVKYTLRIGDGQSTLLFASVLLIALPCVALWVRLLRIYPLVLIWRLALVSLLAAFCALYFAHSLPTAVLGSALVGFGFAGVITTMDLIGARVVDEDAQEHQVRREGTIANAMGILNRLSNLATSLAFFLVFHLYGFESGLNPGLHPGAAARFLLALFPMGLILLALGFSFFTHFDQREQPAPIPAGN